MPEFALVLLAAGRSTRFGELNGQKKPFIDLAGRPVWIRALDPFNQIPTVRQRILVVADGEIEWVKTKFESAIAEFDINVVGGGAERADSVENALESLRPKITHVAIHDAARPFVQTETVLELFAAAVDYGAVIPAARVTSTLKRCVSRVIAETVPREDLWEAQTPQVFRRDLISAAYQERGSFTATDDAQLVERLGHQITVVPSPSTNLKITTQDDLALANFLVQRLCSRYNQSSET